MGTNTVVLLENTVIKLDYFIKYSCIVHKYSILGTSNFNSQGFIAYTAIQLRYKKIFRVFNKMFLCTWKDLKEKYPLHSI